MLVFFFFFKQGPVVPNLRTDFTLPITNINPISFSAPSTNMVTSLASSIPSRVNASTLQFTFSTPIEERRPSSNNQSLNNSDQVNIQVVMIYFLSCLIGFAIYQLGICVKNRFRCVVLPFTSLSKLCFK